MLGTLGNQKDYGSALPLPLAQVWARSWSQQIVAVCDNYLGIQPLTSPWGLGRALLLPFHSEELGLSFLSYKMTELEWISGS